MSRDYEPIGYEVRPGQVEGDWQGVVLYGLDKDMWSHFYPSTTTVRRSRAAVEKAAKRIFERLRDEHGATDLSYSTVRDYVRVRRAQIDLEAGRRVEAMVPQDHAPGAEAEVDFGGDLGVKRFVLRYAPLEKL